MPDHRKERQTDHLFTQVSLISDLPSLAFSNTAKGTVTKGLKSEPSLPDLGIQ